MPSLVHFGQLHDLIKGSIFENFSILIIRINPNLTYEPLTFSIGKLSQKFGLF